MPTAQDAADSYHVTAHIARTVRAVFGGHRPPANELQAMPPTLWPHDGMFLAEWMAGSFTLAGTAMPVLGQSPFDVHDAPAPWRTALFGFGWLRHLPITADPAITTNMQAAISAWLGSPSRHSQVATSPSVTARRVMSWLAHADILLEASTAGTYDVIMRALVADITALQRDWRAADSPAVRLQSLIALAQAGICLTDAARLKADAETGLAHEFGTRRIAHLIPLLRDPDALAALILDLEALRLLYKMRLLPVPECITQSVSLLTKSMAGRLLGDGRPARLGAVAANSQAHTTVAAATRHLGMQSLGVHSDFLAGYARVMSGETCAILDVGAPFDSRSALQIEMSSGNAPLLVHDGLETAAGAETTGPVMFIRGRSAAREGSGPHTEPEAQAGFSLDISESGHQCIDATHAGLAPLGFAHRRRLQLDRAGIALRGVDELRPMVGQSQTVVPAYVIRFVLHPTVTVTVSNQSDQVECVAANGHRWTLLVEGGHLSVEGAAYSDGLRIVPTLQVLVAAGGPASRSVTWQLSRTDVRTGACARDRV